MLFTSILFTSSLAARPDTVSICNYYTEALFKTNTADNQYLLLSALVNRVVIGNFTPTATNVSVPGILANGTFNNQNVSLLPFFTGVGNTTNENGVPSSVNFLDGGGAEPLMKGMPANDTSSRQYFLLTHLYQLFGTLLGCSEQGMTGFSVYQGSPSMYETHKFMNLGTAQNGYFITQVALAAKSFGVADEDIKLVGTALTNLFEQRCSKPMSLKMPLPKLPQAICVADDCKLAQDPQCPSTSSTMMMPTMSSTMMMPSSTKMSTQSSKPTNPSNSACIKNTAFSLFVVIFVFIGL